MINFYARNTSTSLYFLKLEDLQTAFSLKTKALYDLF